MAKKKPNKGNWIADLHMKENAFTAQAAKVNKTVPEFAKQVLKPGSKASATTRKRATLAQTFKKFKKGKK